MYLYKTPNKHICIYLYLPLINAKHYNNYMNAVDRSDQVLAKKLCSSKLYEVVENIGLLT